jgi:hypothetical protein
MQAQPSKSQIPATPRAGCAKQASVETAREAERVAKSATRDAERVAKAQAVRERVAKSATRDAERVAKAQAEVAWSLLITNNDLMSGNFPNLPVTRCHHWCFNFLLLPGMKQLQEELVGKDEHSAALKEELDSTRDELHSTQDALEDAQTEAEINATTMYVTEQQAKKLNGELS